MILPDGDVLVGIFEHGAAIVIYVEVIGGGEDSDHGRELLRGRFAKHGVSVRCESIWAQRP